MADVKTYRVLKDGMRVGDSVRNFGDFMPEAEGLPTMRTLLNSNVIEKVYVDQEEFDEWQEDQKKRDEALAKGLDPYDDDDIEEEIPNEPADNDSDETKATPKVKKRVTKKKFVKRKTTKEKDNGAAEAGNELHSESV